MKQTVRDVLTPSGLRITRSFVSSRPEAPATPPAHFYPGFSEKKVPSIHSQRLAWIQRIDEWTVEGLGRALDLGVLK